MLKDFKMNLYVVRLIEKVLDKMERNIYEPRDGLPYESDTVEKLGLKVLWILVDWKTKCDPWGSNVSKCFEKYGIEIRYGMGQKYDGNTWELLDWESGQNMV